MALRREPEGRQAVRLNASRRPVSAGEASEFWEVPEQPRDEAGSILDEEIGRLPSRYGEAVRLCYLEGLALKDAACDSAVLSGRSEVD